MVYTSVLHIRFTLPIFGATGHSCHNPWLREESDGSGALLIPFGTTMSERCIGGSGYPRIHRVTSSQWEISGTICRSDGESATICGLTDGLSVWI